MSLSVPGGQCGSSQGRPGQVEADHGGSPRNQLYLRRRGQRLLGTFCGVCKASAQDFPEPHNHGEFSLVSVSLTAITCNQ